MSCVYKKKSTKILSFFLLKITVHVRPELSPRLYLNDVTYKRGVAGPQTMATGSKP